VKIRWRKKSDRGTTCTMFQGGHNSATGKMLQLHGRNERVTPDYKHEIPVIPETKILGDKLNQFCALRGGPDAGGKPTPDEEKEDPYIGQQQHLGEREALGD